MTGFQMSAHFAQDLPAPSPVGDGGLPYAFVGGHNDADAVPFPGLAEAAVTVLTREGRNLATYNLGGSAQGYEPLRSFVGTKLDTRAQLPTDDQEILVTSGSLQALDLVNELLTQSGDTVIVEEATYGGMLTRLARVGVDWVGARVDHDGLDPAHVEERIQELAARGVKPKFIYTIPTVQNPTGVVMSRERREQLLEVARAHDVPIFEDDCYADLVWGRARPPAIRALDQATGGDNAVIYCGSFSKSIAPALRVGYIVADQPVIAQLLSLKTDAGTGALEQMVLSEFAASHFDDHVASLTATLEAKSRVMIEAVRRELGDEVEVTEPDGGIFVWLTFPEGVDTQKLAEPARARGVEFNPGAGWSADPEWGARRLRLCFGHPTTEEIDAGVKALGEAYAEYRGAASQ